MFLTVRRLSKLVFTLALLVIGVTQVANAEQAQLVSIQKAFSRLEASSGGRLGLSAINTANNRLIQYRAEERFPFASTSKVMVIAALLKKSEKNPNLLQKKIRYNQEDVDKSGYAPVTGQHINDGMTVHELCKAAIEYSDNTAMNLLMTLLGGPAAVTSYARLLPDTTFQLERWETELNTAIPGDTRDTTTPNAMATSLKRLVLGNSLALPQQKQLQTWLKNNTTGNTKIRAGVPKGWIVGDKTGGGSYGTTNDIAVIWPRKCAPLVLVVYLTQKEKDSVKHDEVIKSAAHLVIQEFAKTDPCIKKALAIA